ncbi:hypothetical protein MC885_006814 [Smutsia gigantea]|nr:hypothetical protein MC885_006814 [Smutsia gigantea]
MFRSVSGPVGQEQTPAPRSTHSSPLRAVTCTCMGVSGTWQDDDNIASRRNTQRQRLSSGSLEDPEHRPCVWGPLAV